MRFLIRTSVFVLALTGLAWQARNPFAGKRLYVDPNSAARKQAESWKRSRPADAALMQRIGDQPQVTWLGDWNRNIRSDAQTMIARITAAGALPVFVVYNIPNRECGSYSAGGAGNGDAYRRWILDLARALNNHPSVIILEPDALAGNDCLPARLKDERYVLIRDAVTALNASGAAVYIDAGHAGWKPANEMATRLNNAGMQNATGFSLNVSNYQSTSSNIAYGNSISRLVGGKHYVIDTSRNGSGRATNEWCNPGGQALGPAPTTNTGQPLVDAYLWIKTPGESDGTCNGGPKAGAWWAEYALELSKAAQAIAGR